MKETKETLLNMNHNKKILTKYTKTNSHKSRKKKITIKITCSITTPQVILSEPVLFQQLSQLYLPQPHLSQQQQQQVSQQDQQLSQQ